MTGFVAPVAPIGVLAFREMQFHVSKLDLLVQTPGREYVW
jgi:hypothetical protein